VKILLIDPPNHVLRPQGGAVQVHPLGLGYLAAVLSPEHDVAQLVCDVKPRAAGELDALWQDIGETVAACAPDLLGITCVTATFPAARRVARIARERLGPAVPIVFGGVHPTFRPEDAFAEPAVDYVVTGEGEEAVVALARALAVGATAAGASGAPGVPGVAAAPIATIGGLLWRTAGGGIGRGPKRLPREDLDTLPFPRREGVLWAEHLQPAFYQSLITVRGCPYKCIYCSVPATDDRQTRYRSAANVADEIAALRREHAVPYLFFHDSVFTLNRKRTVALCEAIIARDLVVPFACQTRADRVDPELLALMKRAGCHQIFFGIESGDAETLRLMKKNVPLQAVRDAVAAVKALGIRCAGFFMIGFPWERRDQILRTADFATALDLDAVSLFSATPLPGTELWEMSEGQPLPETIDFRAPEVNLTAMPHQEYAALFAEVKARVDAYNVAALQRQALQHWPRG
jgi:radical SAM superfamily enzyme YgiQ (UPF0313 family)